ncbi:hypothetical protein MKW92_047117, partial [Papaver armeniacum]
MRAGRESSNLHPPTVEEEKQEEKTRTIKWFEILEECVASIRALETKIRECYSEPVDLNSEEFVEMMIIDGLFLIKMLIRSSSTLCSYDIADDPLDGNDWLLFMVEQDMFLLENQIPLFVLQCLANIVFSAEGLRHMSLTKAIQNFIINRNLQHISPTKGSTLLDRCDLVAKHLLDFFILLIQPPAHKDSASSSSSSWKIAQVLT